MIKRVFKTGSEPVTVSKGLFVWLVMMTFLSPMAVALAGIAYTSWAIHRSDRRFCEVMELSDRPVTNDIKDPALRKRIIEGQKPIHRLRVDLGCVDK